MKKLPWLKKNTFVYTIIGLCLAALILFYRSYTNRIDKKELYCTTTAKCNALDYGKNVIFNVPAQEQLRLFCEISGGVLVEDTRGNRFIVDKDYIRYDDPIVLKKFNPDYEFYVKKSEAALFHHMTMVDIIKKTGSYLCANIQTGKYEFPQIVVMEGKTRHYGLTLFINSDGSVQTVAYGERTSSNWFGSLPFYSTIVSLNMITAFSEPILETIPEPEPSRGIIGWLLVALWNIVKFILFLLLYLLFAFLVFAVALIIILPMRHFLYSIKSMSASLIGLILYGTGIVLSYIVILAQVDGTHSIWLISLPINVLAAFEILIAYAEEDIHKCPKCRKEDAIVSDSTLISRHKELVERENVKTGDTHYAGQRKNKKIYNQDLHYWTTEQEIITEEYRVRQHCIYCNYTNEYTQTKKTKGDKVVTQEWDDSRQIRKSIPQEPEYRGDDSSIQDETGRSYHRTSDSDIGSDVVSWRGNKYKKE
jgi:hypothetical protein